MLFILQTTGVSEYELFTIRLFQASLRACKHKCVSSKLFYILYKKAFDDILSNASRRTLIPHIDVSLCKIKGIRSSRLLQSVWRSARRLPPKGLLHQRAQRSGLRRVSFGLTLCNQFKFVKQMFVNSRMWKSLNVINKQGEWQ